MQYKVIHVYTDYDVWDQIYVGSQTESFVAIHRNSHTESFVDLLTSIQNPIPSINVNQADIDYDIEGTDEDDFEVVHARDRVMEDKKEQLSYEEELKMLE